MVTNNFGWAGKEEPGSSNSIQIEKTKTWFIFMYISEKKS
jgi:hypothetical protein